MDKFEYLAKMLKSHRRFKGYTQKEVAKKLNIPYQDYQKYEYGIHIPKRKRYIELCEAMKIPKNNIFYQMID